jgi:hypothetical protein
MNKRRIISISLPEELIKRLSEYSKETGVPRSRVIEKALQTFLNLKPETPTPLGLSEKEGVKHQLPKVSEIAVEEMKKNRIRKIDPEKFW